MTAGDIKKEKGFGFRFTKLFLFVVLVLALFHAWLFLFAPLNLKAKVLKAVPYPVAFAGGKTLLSQDFFHRFDQALIFYRLDNNNLSDDEIAKITYNTLIEEKKLAALAQKYGVSTNRQVAKQLTDKFRETQGNQKNYIENSRLYGLTPDDFADQIEIDLLRGLLASWHNGQKKFNPKTYDQAESLLEQARQTNKFSELATKYSQDKATQIFGGSLGLVGLNNLNPELWPTIDGMQEGELRIAPSREGLHLLKLESKGKGENTGEIKYNLSQIFFKLTSFEKWYTDESKKVEVKQLIKL